MVNENGKPKLMNLVELKNEREIKKTKNEKKKIQQHQRP